MYKLPNSKGFTLMELLVVISIISILSAILYASFSDARQDAKNKAIQSEMMEVQLAIELYKSQNGVYPPTNSSCDASSGVVDSASTNSCINAAYIDGIVGDFIAEIPAKADSANVECNFVYQVESAGLWYKFTAEECHAGADAAAEGVQLGGQFARCLSSCLSAPDIVCDADYVGTAEFYESYAVYSDGGQCK